MRFVILLIPLFAFLALSCGEEAEPTPTPTATASPAAPTGTPEAAASETLAFLRDGDVWLIDADGNNERRLNLAGVESFSWVSATELDVVTDGDQPRHLLVDLDGNATELPFPTGGTWSQDGTRYVAVVNEQVVVYNRDRSEYARFDVEPPVETGEKPRPCGGALPDSGQPDRLVFSRPEFSPDEQSVLVAVNCVSRAGATGNLYAPVASVSLVDGTQRQTDLQVNLEDGPGARFAPDGSRVAQAIRFGGSACGGGFSVFVGGADGANATELPLPAAAAPPEDPGGEVRGGLVGYDWAPNSEAVVASVDVSICPRFDIDPSAELRLVEQALYIVPLDGSPEEKLLDGPTRSPAWSPSGRYIAYVSQEYFGQEIGPPLLRVIDLETREVVDLGQGEQPAWRPQAASRVIGYGGPQWKNHDWRRGRFSGRLPS